MQGSDGNFYGTTYYGGANDDGTVFQITPGGSLTTLYSFADGQRWGQSLAGLVQGSDSNFYGTTIRRAEPKAMARCFRSIRAVP